MLRKLTRIVPVTTMALLLGLAAVATRAEPTAPAPATPAPAGKASVVVTVVDGDGKPVQGAKVTLVVAPAGGGKHQKAANKRVDPPATAPAGGAEAPAKPAKADPVATGTTDADGKATLAGVADGTYAVRARLKAVGNGRGTVTVVDGKDAAVSVTLKPAKAKA